VRDDTDVSDFFDWMRACHVSLMIYLYSFLN
jgi:hypothetical protein